MNKKMYTRAEAQKLLRDNSILLVDTRERNNPQLDARLEIMDFPRVERVTLAYGDYALDVVFPDGTRLYNPEETISPRYVVERKMDPEELCTCLGRDRERFLREFERGKQAGAQIVLIVEDGSWDALYKGYYRSRMGKRQVIGSLTAIANRGVMVYPCGRDVAPGLAKRLLTEDLTRRLMSGNY